MIRKMKIICNLTLSFVLLFSVLPANAEESSSVNLWLSEYEADACAEGIRLFEENYPEVELEITTYSDDNRNEEIQKMQTQLMGGKGPDLLLFSSYGNEDVYKLMKAHVFASLNEFMEEDKNWNRQEYIESVLDAGIFDGEQYVMPLRYQFPTMLTTQGRLNEMGKTAEDLSTTLSILEEMALLKDTHDQIFASGGFVYILYLGDPLVDYTTGKVGIDRELLEKACTAYCKIFDEANVVADADHFLCSYGKKIAGGEAFFYLPPSIEGMIGNAMGAAVSDTPVLLPLRTIDGLTTAEINLYAGIRANSDNKQASWNLLRCLLSEEAQIILEEEGGNLPVSRAALEAAFAGKEETVKRYIEGYEAGELPEGFMEKFQSLSENPDRALFISHVCMADFYETMTPFYQGSKSFEECYTEFESFVKIYTSE